MRLRRALFYLCVLGVLVCGGLSGCEKENPGLALEIKLPATIASKVSQVVITVTNPAGTLPMQPMGPSMQAGVSVGSDGTTATITISTPDFHINDDFQLLFVPSGRSTVLLNISGRMFMGGGQIGTAKATDVSIK